MADQLEATTYDDAVLLLDASQGQNASFFNIYEGGNFIGKFILNGHSLSPVVEPAYDEPQHERLIGRTALAEDAPWNIPDAYSGSTAATRQEVSPGASPEYLNLDDDRRLRWVTYFDTPENKEMADAVARGRAQQYYNAGHINTTEGAGGQRGRNVEIIALWDDDAETPGPVASIRLVHGELEQLPTYIKAQQEQAIHEEGRRILAERTDGRPIAEVADLWKYDKYPSEVALELYMRAAHVSMGRREVWIIGAVGPEVRTLQRLFGPHVVHLLGRRIDVHDPTARKGVTITPILINPTTAVGDLLDWIDEAEIAVSMAATNGGPDARELQEQYYYRQMILWGLVDGAPDLDDVTSQRLWSLRHGSAA